MIQEKSGATKEGTRKSAKLKREHPVAQLLDRKWLVSSSVESDLRAAIKELVMLLQKALLYCDRAGIFGKCQVILPCYFLDQPRLTTGAVPDSGTAI